jgi:hypothetical protein
MMSMTSTDRGRIAEILRGLGLAALTVGFAAGCIQSAGAAVYYVAAGGDDGNDGLAPERAWRSLHRVNVAALKPGDTVLFKRGDVWRGQLLPKSGQEGAPVTYGAYGEGQKPLLLGSVAMSRPEDWRQIGPNLWSAGGVPEAEPASVLTPPQNPQELHFGLHTEGGAVATRAVGEDGVHRILCSEPGRTGAHMQYYTTGLKLEEGHAYRFSFHVRCTAPFKLEFPRLMKSGAPYTAYTSNVPPSLEITPTKQQAVGYFVSNVTAEDGRITFYLGGALPKGATLELSDLASGEVPLTELPKVSALPVDVGNIIFGNETACGAKKWTLEDLKQQGDYWYDPMKQRVVVWSERNPAEQYGMVECALGRHIINEGGCSYVTYENLALKYGAAHGIGGGGTHHITVRSCDFGFIGGADQYGGGTRRVRFGNGVEFWGNAHDNLVERCKLWEIYDAALTNQNNGPNVHQYNIIYRYNVIWNSEYSFEYWNRPESSETHDIYFINNTCLNAGHGWGHSQRPDPSGRHLCFYSSDAPAQNIVIANNVFYEATKNAFYAPWWKPEWIRALRIDHNIWVQREGTMVAFKDRGYTMQEFAQYQADWGLEPHSLATDPLLVDPAKLDFHLRDGSPCIDAGADFGSGVDFDGRAVPQGKATDIGAYEHAVGA